MDLSPKCPDKSIEMLFLSPSLTQGTNSEWVWVRV